jgi:methionyl-tRNA formyltransferase
MNPWPGAFTLVRTAENSVKQLKVHRALPVHRVSGRPGIVQRLGNRGVLVACGQGALLLLEVQLEGKRRMDAVEFVRGFALPVGIALGV